MLRHALPRVRAVAALALFGLLVAAGQLSAQPTTNKKVLTFADYDIWRSATGVTLSRDGQYVAYLLGSEGTDGEAVVRNIASGKEYRFTRGATSSGIAAGALPGAPAPAGPAPKFAPDSKRVFLPLTPTKAQLEKAKTDKLKSDEYPKGALAIVDLASGTELERITGVSSYQLAGEGAGFLIYRKGGRKGPRDRSQPHPGKGKSKGADSPPGTPPPTKFGTDLHIRDLSSTVERTIPEVTEFSLTNDEKTLVYVVSSKTEAKNGVYALNPRFGTAATPLKVGPGRYSGIAWDEKQTRLAFFYDDSQVPAENVAPAPRPVGPNPGTVGGDAPGANTPPQWRVFVWDRFAKSEPTGIARVPLGTSGTGFAALLAPVVATVPTAPSPLTEVFSPDTPGMKKGWSINAGGLSFSQDGTKLYVSAAPQRPTPVARPPAPGDFELDIWHWKDEAIQPMQKLTAAADRGKTYGGVLLLDTKQFRHLSDEALSVQAPVSGDWAVASDNSKYRHTTGYAFPVPSDYSLVNVRTGATKALLNASNFGVNLSPNGKYLLGFDSKDWFTLSVPDGKKTNLTAKLGVKFFDEDHDVPSEPSPYRTAEWTTDGKFVLVSDRFDIWKIAADGSSPPRT